MGFADCPIGCASSETCCCIEGEFCCKPGVEMLCLGCCALRLISPTTCMKVESQMCCSVAGVAIPCDDEVPCMVSLCFLHCYPQVGCCMQMSTLVGNNNGEGRVTNLPISPEAGVALTNRLIRSPPRFQSDCWETHEKAVHTAALSHLPNV